MEDPEVKVFATTTDFGEEYKGWWVADSVRQRVLEVTRLLLPMTVKKSYSVTVSLVDMVIGNEAKPHLCLIDNKLTCISLSLSIQSIHSTTIQNRSN